MKYSAIVLLAGLALSGCMSKNSSSDIAMYGAPLSGNSALNVAADEVQSDRMLIWRGAITLEVAGVAETQEDVTACAKAVGGYVESSHQRKYQDRPSVTLTLRVPSEKLQQVVGGLEGMGEVIAKSLSSEDVTERYIDTQARLETKIKLRDRLQALLEKAADVKDILAIEKELTRLQGDIDSMTARLKSMKGKVDYASLEVTLNAQKQEQVLGPLGYVFKGTAWVVKKLFIWKDESYVEEPPAVEPVPVMMDRVPEQVSECSGPEVRVVYPGETLEDIARQYGVTEKEIRELNGLGDATVSPGQKLLIPFDE